MFFSLSLNVFLKDETKFHKHEKQLVKYFVYVSMYLYCARRKVKSINGDGLWWYNVRTNFEFYLLGCNTMYSTESQATFWRSMSPLSSGSKMSQARN
jgi:hypothetical protein